MPRAPALPHGSTPLTGDLQPVRGLLGRASRTLSVSDRLLDKPQCLRAGARPSHRSSSTTGPRRLCASVEGVRLNTPSDRLAFFRAGVLNGILPTLLLSIEYK